MYQSQRPLPDVPGHVVEAVPVRREAPTGDVPSKPSTFRFCQGNSPCQELAIALPSGKCSSPHANTAPSRPPRAANSHSASVGSSFPAQRRVGLGVLVGDVDDRVAVAAVDRRALPSRPLPVRAGEVLPPVAIVVEVDRARGLAKTSDPGTARSGSASGYCSRSSGRSATVTYFVSRTKRRKSAAVTGWASIQNPSTDTRHGPLLRIEVLGAHRERAARDPAHAGCGGGPGAPNRLPEPLRSDARSSVARRRDGEVTAHRTRSGPSGSRSAVSRTPDRLHTFRRLRVSARRRRPDESHRRADTVRGPAGTHPGRPDAVGLT